MKRMATRKSYSWWWDSHISRNKSKWLEDNLQKMDQTVNQMLKLIEEEGESFAKKAEIYYQRRPELISHVEDFYRMYRALAERYDKATRDHCNNTKSEQNSPCSRNGSDVVSDPPSPSSIHSLEVTPDSRPPKTIQTSRAAGFDVFLGSEGCPDLSRKGSVASCSSSSESDSDSEFNDSNEANGNASSSLHCRIHEPEDELHELREKREAQEKSCHDHCGLKILAMQEEILLANEKIDTLETENVAFKKKLEDTYISPVNKDTELSSAEKTASYVEKENNVLQSAIIDHRHELEVLEGAAEAAAKQFRTELSNRDSKIKECENEQVSAKGKFWQEKSSLKAQIAELGVINMRLTAECQKVLEEKTLIEARLSEQEIMIQELKASTRSTEKIFGETLAFESEVVSLRDQVRQAEADRIQACKERRKHIIQLNENLEALTSTVDKLTSEKDALTAEVIILTNDVKYRDDRIDEMDQHLHHLHLEHAKLIMEIEEARTASSDMKSRIKELEEEVERQKDAISDGAEGKREAIRQLCVSIEHYRDSYEQLLQLLQGHKRSTIAAN